MTATVSIITGILALVIGFYAAYLFLSRKSTKARTKADQIVEDARKQAEEILRKAQEESARLRMQMLSDIETERKNRIKEVEYQEKRLAEKEQLIDRRADVVARKEQELMKREKNLEHREEAVKAKEERYTKLLEEENIRLERISGLTREEARQILLDNVKEQVKHEAARIAREIKQKAKEEAEREAKEIIAYAIQRCATDHIAETTISVVPLPNDDMKGRIIGREGRNIRTFENITGVEVIIDDTPEAVTLSSFDPVRREMARMALEELVQDGRIHPARIEEVVAKAEKEINELIKKTGEETVLELGLPGLHPELKKLVGKLRFRTSYGQNVLQHSKEVAYLAWIMAGELGLDPQIAKRAGLLHDIGKAVPQEYEGTHASIGAELAQRYGEDPIVVNAIEAHHEDVEPISPYAVIVQAADAISGSRPGARRETLEAYLKRLEKLEEIAKQYDGVGKVFAMQAGREIRIIVEPDKVDDEHTEDLAEDIARQIEKEVKYPGQIKVTVIRETRAVEYAK